MARLAKTELLILDDFGITPLSVLEARDLLEVIDERTLTRSTLVASQLPLEMWHGAISRPYTGRRHPRSPDPQRPQDPPEGRVHAEDEKSEGNVGDADEGGLSYTARRNNQRGPGAPRSLWSVRRRTRWSVCAETPGQIGPIRVVSSAEIRRVQFRGSGHRRG